MPGAQELIALALVALIVGWVYWRRRKRKASACGDCAKPATDAGESRLTFYRRTKADDQPGQENR